jgi:hypothetical protein
MQTMQLRLFTDRRVSADAPTALDSWYARALARLSGSSWAIASLLCLAYVAWYAQLS